MTHPYRLARLTACGTLAVALSACGGGGSSGSNPGLVGTQCSTGTQVEIASPRPGQTGVSTSIGNIVLVANGNGNYLYQTYTTWQVALVDTTFGNQYAGGTLGLTTDPNGFTPFASNYYYSASIPPLNPGLTYNVYLQQTNAACPQVGINSFST